MDVRKPSMNLDKATMKIKKARNKYNEVNAQASKGRQYADRARDLTGGENIISQGTKEFGLEGIPILGDVAGGFASVGDAILNLFGYEPDLTEEELEALKEKFVKDSIQSLREKVEGTEGIQLKLPNGKTARLVAGKPPERNYTPTKEQKKTAKKIRKAVDDDLVNQVQNWYQEYSSGYGTLAYKYKNGPNKGDIIQGQEPYIERWGYHMFGFPGHEFPLSTRLEYFKKFLEEEKGITDPEKVDAYERAYKKYINAREK
jgi:hypothetical protein